VAAQQYSAAVISEARDLFRAGLTAMREERYQDALRAFSQAYALVPQPQTLLNLAGAQVRTGRLVSATESYRRFLRDAAQGPAAVYRDDAQRALDEAERKVARVRVEARGLSETDRVTLDGVSLAPAALSSEVRVDPGEHVLAVARDDAEVARATFVAGEGEARTVRLAVPVDVLRVRPSSVVTEHATSRPSRVQRRRSDPADESASPWPWIAVGGALLVAGAIAFAIVWVSTEPEPYASNLPPTELP